MDFNPPANAKVISADEFVDAAQYKDGTSIKYDGYQDNYFYRGCFDLPTGETDFQSPAAKRFKDAPHLVIEGDIDLKGKFFTAICDGLWIKGNVTNGRIRVESGDYYRASVPTVNDKRSRETRIAECEIAAANASEKGNGLFITGNVKNSELTAHNVGIGGNVEMDKAAWGGHFPTTVIDGNGGYINVDGSVAGQANELTPAERLAANPHHEGIEDGVSATEYYKYEMDRLTATKNITIGGDVGDVALESKTGKINLSPRAEQSGHVVFIEKGASFSSSPSKTAGAVRA